MGNHRICYGCGSDSTTMRNNRNPIWNLNHDLENNVLCHKCFNKYISNPIWHPITGKKWNPILHKRWSHIHNSRRLKFKDKRIRLNFNPRKGICQKCYRKVGEGIKRTVIHHIQYHEDDPLKDTIELCNPCHRAEHRNK